MEDSANQGQAAHRDCLSLAIQVVGLVMVCRARNHVVDLVVDVVISGSHDGSLEEETWPAGHVKMT